MEFIKVTVPGRESGSSGFVSISVDLPGAEEKIVEVKNTTAEHPMIIEVRV